MTKYVRTYVLENFLAYSLQWIQSDVKICLEEHLQSLKTFLVVNAMLGRVLQQVNTLCLTANLFS